MTAIPANAYRNSTTNGVVMSRPPKYRTLRISVTAFCGGNATPMLRQ